MAKYKVKEGIHVEKGKEYKKGEEVESNDDLTTLFPGKFESADGEKGSHGKGEKGSHGKGKGEDEEEDDFVKGRSGTSGTAGHKSTLPGKK